MGSDFVAEGMREDEIGLPEPDWVETVADSPTRMPVMRGPRRVMFQSLPGYRVPGYAPICLDTRDPLTIEYGMRQRLKRRLPTPNPGLMDEFKQFCSIQAEMLPSDLPYLFEEALAMTNFPEWRKDELRRADADNKGGAPPPQICRRVNAFIKTEFYQGLRRARWICSRHDRFKAFVMGAFRKIEDIVYHTMPEFIKHVPVKDRPAALASLRKAGRRYYVSDYTAFESHFTPEVMRACEFVFYKHILKNWTYMSTVEEAMMGVNHITNKTTGYRTKVLGKRMSGEMCTSVGNGLTNLMLAKFIAWRQGKEVYGFVEGDDAIFSTEADLSPERYAELGFTVKLCEVNDPLEQIPLDKEKFPPGSILFCGICAASDQTAIKHYAKFFQGFSWTSSFMGCNVMRLRELLKCKALSALQEFPACPIVTCMAREALRHNNVNVSASTLAKFNKDHFGHELHGMTHDAHEPSLVSREFYEHAFGVTIQDQLLVEEAIKKGDMITVSAILPSPYDSAWYEARYVMPT